MRLMPGLQWNRIHPAISVSRFFRAPAMLTLKFQPSRESAHFGAAESEKGFDVVSSHFL